MMPTMAETSLPRSTSVAPALPALAQHSNRLLAVMLLLMHAAFVWGEGEPWGRAVILMHYGVFLLWQPFLSGVQRLSWSRALAVVGVGIWLAVWPSLWVGMFWSAMLAALLGGTAMGLATWRERWGMGLGVVYILALLLLWILPKLFGLGRHPLMHTPLRDLLLVLPLALAFMPAPRQRMGNLATDVLYALLLFLLIGVQVLGSFVAMRLVDTSYLHGLLISTLSLAAALIAFAWLWNPRGEFAGLGSVFSRYVLSLGLPLEDWLKQTAEAAEREPDPEAFLRITMEGFSTLPWARGVRWQTAYSQGQLGRLSRHEAEFSDLGVTVRFYADRPLNPAFSLHLRLLMDVVDYFYAAKIREQALHANAYTQAVYETGARLTHDVKNMLQSLKTLSSAAERSGPDQAMDLQSLVQRQLPQLVKRLEITLDKLKSPQKAKEEATAPGEILFREWWRNLKNRYVPDEIDFQTDDPNAELWLDQELFDSVADNLLQNALRKRRQDPDIHIRVWFAVRSGPLLRVCDDGNAAPQEVVGKLFHTPVSTYDGLGIGLYQAAKQAAALGFVLQLLENRDGGVCFRLAGR
jgi:signal transduction histidine kinase